MKRIKPKEPLNRVIVIVVVAALLVTAPGIWMPAITLLAQRTAMLSAAIAMPEGSIAALEERFKSEVHIVTREGEPQAPGVPIPESSSWPSSPSTPESSSSAPHSSREPAELPDIPKERRRPVLAEDMSGIGNSNYLTFGKALIRNDTKYSYDQVKAVLASPMELELADTDEPQVLIIHTHATEAYTPFDMDYYDTAYTWRTTDNNENIIAVGDALSAAIEGYGITVIHDKTLHDYPSYNGGYDRSAATVEDYLEKYPSIQVVFDVHRDAIERDNEVIVKPTVEINGWKAAQLMVISCADNGNIGIPNWERNFRFAANMTSTIGERYPGIMRPIFLCHRKYNQHLTDGSLLLEFGTHASTLEESIYTAKLVGEVIGDFLSHTVPI